MDPQIEEARYQEYGEAKIVDIMTRFRVPFDMESMFLDFAWCCYDEGYITGLQQAIDIQGIGENADE